jgi:hypothetical protein
MRSAHSTLEEAVAFVKTERGWRCKHAREYSKTLQNFKINSLLVHEGGG